ncbi:uncharacterized protein LOC111251534 isoform X3 [Varroa destructor]|uniref:FHA domain-containing protein n=1 Tax=Varroa destructor TaxID=109461 RepID=A0A7M7KP93_VARDE|nr:uncharacterized protein LOC111251534 isoform X3 [Varroa destructor]
MSKVSTETKIRSKMLFGNLQIIKRDGSDGSHFPITSDTVFGSDPSADVKLKVAGVAKRQCRIIPCVQTKKMQLEVLDDRCGETHINGAKLSAGEVRDLYNADILTVTDRKFKIFYPLPSAKRQVSKTPGSVTKLKRRSIFNRTPPNFDAPGSQRQQQQRQQNELKEAVRHTPSGEVRRRSQSLSPKPRKSILSAKKNLLVARTPTMSPKVVTWGNNRYKSPDRSPSPKKIVRIPRHTIGATSALAAAVNEKKRNIGHLDEKIKRLASSSAPSNNMTSTGPLLTPISRSSILESSTPINSSVLPVKVTETPLASKSPVTETARLTPVFSNVKVKETPKLLTTLATAPMPVATKSPAMPTSKMTVVVAGPPAAQIKSPANPTKSPVVASKPLMSPLGEDQSIASAGLNRKTRSSQSFSFGDEHMSTASAFLDENLSMITQPSDSFGSLSVSDVDLSLFTGSVANDSTINSPLRSRRSSSGSSLQNSSASGRALKGTIRSPKTPVLSKVQKNEEAEVISAQRTPQSQHSVVKEKLMTPLATGDEKAGLATDEISAESESNIIDVADIKQVEGVSNSLGTKQESIKPAEKTWAGILKKNISSGSHFKVKPRKSHKIKAVGRSKFLQNKTSKSDLAVEIVAAASTGHLLSPQTIFVNKKLMKFASRTFVTPLSKSRKFSFGSMTPDIETDMFVSPLKTPDNSEAISRASAFVANADESADLEPHYSNVSSLNEPVASPVRSPRNSVANENSFVHSNEADGKINVQNVTSVGSKLGTSKKRIRPLATSQKNSPLNSLEDVRGIKRLMTATSPLNVLDDFDGVKQLLQTPKVRKQLEDSLDNVENVMQLFATLKETQSGRNSFSDVMDVKNIVASSTESKTPESNLDHTFNGVRVMVATQTETRGLRSNLDITSENVKNLLNTRTHAQSPKNNLDISFGGVKELVTTPAKSPENNLDITFRGLKKMVTTPTEARSPKNNLDITFRGVKKLLNTPPEIRSPINNLDRSFKGLRRMLATPQKDDVAPNDSVLGDIADLMRSPVVSPRKRTPGSPAASEAKRRRSKEAAKTAAPLRDNEHVISIKDILTGKSSDSAICSGEKFPASCHSYLELSDEKDEVDVENTESLIVKPHRDPETVLQKATKSKQPEDIKGNMQNVIRKRIESHSENERNQSNTEKEPTEREKVPEPESVTRARSRRGKRAEFQEVAPQAIQPKGKRGKKGESKDKQDLASIEGQKDDEEFERFASNQSGEDTENNESTKFRVDTRSGRFHKGQESESQVEFARKQNKRNECYAASTRGHRGQVKDIEKGPTMSDEPVAASELAKLNIRKNESKQDASKSRKIKSKITHDENLESSETSDNQVEQGRNTRAKAAKKDSLVKTTEQAKGQNIIERRGRRAAAGKKEQDQSEEVSEAVSSNTGEPDSIVTQDDTIKTLTRRQGTKAVDSTPIALKSEDKPKRGRGRAKNIQIETLPETVGLKRSEKKTKTLKNGSHKGVGKESEPEEEHALVSPKTPRRGRGKKVYMLVNSVEDTPATTTTAEPEGPKKSRARGTRAEPTEANGSKKKSSKAGAKRPLEEELNIKEAAPKRRALKNASDDKDKLPASTRVTRTRRP